MTAKKARRSYIRPLSIATEHRLYYAAECAGRLREMAQLLLDVWGVLEAHGVKDPIVRLLVG